MNKEFFEMLLDSLPDGIYVLNRERRFIYVNAAYCAQLNMTRDRLLGTDVHDFLKTKQIDFCIADMVVEQSRQVVLFQDVYDPLGTGRKPFRQLVVATPLFDEFGEICYIFAVFRRMETLNQEYTMASRNEAVSARMDILPDQVKQEDIIAESPQMRHILRLCRDVADTDATVLITGESGTGKEVVASYIHKSSTRSEHPLVVINCASLPENLLEAELFGHEKGAFTGAASSRIGLVEQADRGTLFLDEINSMPLGLQSKLLRVLETKSIRHVGSNKERIVDFRLVAATNENLETLIEEKRFRKDLYYRINVVPVRIPPLRERKEDIIPLAMNFLKSFCQKNGKDKSFSPQMLDRIRSYEWPGNVRELKNFVERSVLISTDHSISLPYISTYNEGIDSPGSLTTVFKEEPKNDGSQQAYYVKMVQDGITMGQYLETQERLLLEWAQKTYGSTYKMAEALGTTQAGIMRRKKKYHI